MITQELKEKLESEKYEDFSFDEIVKEFNLESDYYCREASNSIYVYTAFKCSDGYLTYFNEHYVIKGLYNKKLNSNRMDLLSDFIFEFEFYDCNTEINIYNFDQLEELDEWIKKHNIAIYQILQEELEEWYKNDEENYCDEIENLNYEYNQVPH